MKIPSITSPTFATSISARSGSGPVLRKAATCIRSGPKWPRNSRSNGGGGGLGLPSAPSAMRGVGVGDGVRCTGGWVGSGVTGRGVAVGGTP